MNITGEMLEKAARQVAEGGWSSIYDLVADMDAETFKDKFSYIMEDYFCADCGDEFTDENPRTDNVCLKCVPDPNNDKLEDDDL